MCKTEYYIRALDLMRLCDRMLNKFFKALHFQFVFSAYVISAQLCSNFISTFSYFPNIGMIGDQHLSG